MIGKSFVLSLLGALVLGACAQATAPLTLTHPFGPNSTVRIDPYSQTGLYDWVVENTDQVAQDWYWYRIGSAGTAQSIDAIGNVTINQEASSLATVTFDGAAFSLSVQYSLYGGDWGSGTSDLSETVTVTNKTNGTLDFHLFEYSNHDLNGTAGNDTAWLENSTHVDQRDGAFASNTSQVGVNLAPDRWEISTAPTLVNKLNNVAFGDLSNSVTPLTGDVSYALQWNLPIAAGGSLQISKDRLVRGARPPEVPEPSGLPVVLSTLGCFVMMRRRSKPARSGGQRGGM